MISEKIKGAIVAINGLAGKVPTEAWEILSCAQRELKDAADQARRIENRVTLTDLEGASNGRTN